MRIQDPNPSIYGPSLENNDGYSNVKKNNHFIQLDTTVPFDVIHRDNPTQKNYNNDLIEDLIENLDNYTKCMNQET